MRQDLILDDVSYLENVRRRQLSHPFASVVNHQDVLHVPDVLQRVTVEHQEVGPLTRREGPAVSSPKHFRAIPGRTQNRLHRTQTRLDQQLQLAMFRKAGNSRRQRPGIGPP